jgi:hypothetical protein
MTNTAKRAWMQPKLKILVRGKPEENVLTVCKTGGQIGPGSTGCILTLAPPGCESIGDS